MGGKVGELFIKGVFFRKILKSALREFIDMDDKLMVLFCKVFYMVFLGEGNKKGVRE